MSFYTPAGPEHRNKRMTWRKEATVRETNPDDATGMSAICDTTEVELHEVDGAATYDSSLA